MKFIIILLLALFGGCLLDSSKPCSNPIPKIEDQNLTVILVDISGTFNKKGDISDKNYLALAMTEIEREVSKAKVGNSYFVGSISSTGFEDNRFFANLELTDSTYYFLQQEPCDPFLQNDYLYSKKEFEKNTSMIIEDKKNVLLKDISDFKANSIGKPSSNTDICCAIESSFLLLKDKKYDKYRKKIIIYSDMKDEPVNNCCSNSIDCQNIEILARYVLTEGHTPTTFQKLKSRWRKYFNNANGFEFQSPKFSTNK